VSPLPSPPIDHPPADPTALDRLVESLVASGLFATIPGGVDLLDSFRRTILRFAVEKMPCPQTFGLNFDPPVAGGGYTYTFSSAKVPFHYSLTIVRLDTAGDRVVYQVTQLFNGTPFEFVIPNKIPGTNNDMFENGVSYQFILQPTLKFGTVEVAYGCVQSQSMSVSNMTLHQIIFAALALWPPKDG
jgi:hypothetical protein